MRQWSQKRQITQLGRYPIRPTTFPSSSGDTGIESGPPNGKRALRSARSAMPIRPREVGVYLKCRFAELSEVGVQFPEARSELRVAAAQIGPRVVQSDAATSGKFVGRQHNDPAPSGRPAGPRPAREGHTPDGVALGVVERIAQRRHDEDRVAES